MSSVIITFTSISKGKEDVYIELDDERNNGKTEFLYGEKAYFKVYADPALTLTVKSSDGTITSEGSGSETVETTLSFIEGKEQTLQKPCVSIQSYSWFGNSLGTITKKDLYTVQSEKEPQPAGANGVALALLIYSTNFKRYAVSIPQKDKDEYPVLVVVYGS